ncbi:MAG TPA: nucleotidyltransferase domain-containing protein [Thermomicrobiales bacterium]|nr:nucleotidyltransferase domain-containing protein [Thermomicrobiales bacterium]
MSSKGVRIVVAGIIEQHRDGIVALCRKHRVRALWVFGSATTEAWNPETSDIDFLVDLGEYDAQVHRRFFGLLHDLEDLTGRPLDLLTINSIENPYFLEEVNSTKVLLYGSPDTEAAA